MANTRRTKDLSQLGIQSSTPTIELPKNAEFPRASRAKTSTAKHNTSTQIRALSKPAAGGGYSMNNKPRQSTPSISPALTAPTQRTPPMRAPTAPPVESGLSIDVRPVDGGVKLELGAGRGIQLTRREARLLIEKLVAAIK